MKKNTEIRTLLNPRTGVKYLALPDLITLLDNEKEGRPEEVQKFIGNFIVTLATTRATGL